MFTVDDGILDEQFSLLSKHGTSKTSEDGIQENRHRREAEPSAEDQYNRAIEVERVDEERTDEVLVRRPVPVQQLVRDAEAERTKRTSHKLVDEHLPHDIEDVNECVKVLFHLPRNKDVVIREFTIGTHEPVRALAVFVDGMSDKTIINTHILQPLMLLTHLTGEDIHRRIDVVKKALVPGNQVTQQTKWKGAVAGILSGSTAVFVDGCEQALIVETKGWEHRTVGTTQNENVVRGPQDAFTESFRANTGLVRSKLRSEHLITEIVELGTLAATDVAIMYVEGLTNPSLVDEVRRRIKAIDVDYISDSGLLEQFIEDNPKVLIPQTLATERPDRIAHMLSEGHVAIFVGNNPYVVAVPVVFWTLMHSPEDAYLKPPFGSFLRLIRWIAVLLAVFTPGFYVAVTNYHPEMIPTDLMLAIAGSREQVPFPVIAEVLIMEFAIELIREAGIRIPSAIGPTIGIVGALIIGQAAVQAGVVSPLLVIVVAVTALASFTIPNYNLGFGVRIARFAYLLAGATFGFYGITLLFCVMMARLAVQKSFGVPLFAPVAPSMDSSRDVIRRGPAYTMNQRPGFLRTLDDWRQQPYTRTWSAVTEQGKKSGKNGDE